MIARGEVWWAELAEPHGSAPGYRRPIVVVQADSFNRSRLQTVVAGVLSSNLALADAPGNVVVPRNASRLPKDSVANVSQIVTLDRDDLVERTTRLSARLLAAIDAGLALVLDL